MDGNCDFPTIFPYKELVQHPIDSQPFLEFKWIFEGSRYLFFVFLDHKGLYLYVTFAKSPLKISQERTADLCKGHQHQTISEKSDL